MQPENESNELLLESEIKTLVHSREGGLKCAYGMGNFTDCGFRQCSNLKRTYLFLIEIGYNEGMKQIRS